MKRKWKISGPITESINKKAKEILSQQLCFDKKRAEFKKALDVYYANETLDSESLVIRLSEIDSYTNRFNDILLSAAIGSMLSLFFTETYQGSGSALVAFLRIIFLAIITLVSIIYFTKKILGDLSAYQRLHCELYEKDLIEQILNNRLAHTEECCSIKSHAANAKGISVDGQPTS